MLLKVVFHDFVAATFSNVSRFLCTVLMHSLLLFLWFLQESFNDQSIGEAIGIVMTEDGAGSLTAQLMEVEKRHAEIVSRQHQSDVKLALLRQTRAGPFRCSSCCPAWLIAWTEKAQSMERCAPAYRSLVQEREGALERIASQQKQLEQFQPET